MQPKDGMKKLVWSETRSRAASPSPAARGAADRHGALPGLAVRPGFAGAPWGSRSSPPTYYEDVAVFAVPAPAGGETAAGTYRTEGPAPGREALVDGDLETTARSCAAEGAAIVVTYAAPQTIRSARSSSGALTFWDPTLPRVSRPATTARLAKVSEIPATGASTRGFAPVSAPEFRVVFPPIPSRESAVWDDPGADDSFFAMLTQAPKTVGSASSACLRKPRVDQFEAKAGFHVARRLLRSGQRRRPRAQVGLLAAR